ncbi:MAG TPA: hypothetical protein VJ831_15705, partial [Jatrophihabitantaceae bacterium]|nr:hypothetical protein [Jatrophihabitantaceae bacterium]
MTFAGVWLRLELRRRWRSLLVLVLLVATSATVVVTALAAARRGASSVTRLNERTLPATVAVLANTPGFDWGPVRTLPEVAAFTNFVVDYAMAVDGVDGNAIGFPFTDDQMMRTLERPVLLAGRLPDPTRADEVIVTRKFRSNYSKGVGDSLTVRLPSAQQLDASLTGQTPTHFAGPVVRVHIV